MIGGAVLLDRLFRFFKIVKKERRGARVNCGEFLPFSLQVSEFNESVPRDRIACLLRELLGEFP